MGLCCGLACSNSKIIGQVKVILPLPPHSKLETVVLKVIYAMIATESILKHSPSTP